MFKKSVFCKFNFPKISCNIWEIVMNTSLLLHTGSANGGSSSKNCVKRKQIFCKFNYSKISTSDVVIHTDLLVHTGSVSGSHYLSYIKTRDGDMAFSDSEKYANLFVFYFYC